MLKFQFSVYDEKAQFFSPPFTQLTAAEAIRTFGAAVNDPQSQLSQFPNDYVLYAVGSFDDSTGVITPMTPDVLSRGSELVRIMSVRSEDKPDVG